MKGISKKDMVIMRDDAGREIVARDMGKQKMPE